MSLFSGAGGLDAAFESTGSFRTVARVELQPEYCETLRLAERAGQLGPAPIFEEDIRTVAVADVIAGAGSSGSRTLLGVIGGPPCESFSTMGKRKGVGDPRGTLVMAFADFVIKAKADFFVLENVPQLATAGEGQVLQEFIDAVANSGYSVDYRILNAADYGAFTSRKRLFVVGVQGSSNYSFPQPSHSKDGSSGPSWIGVGLALSGLPAPSDNPPGALSGHYAVKHKPEVVERFSTVAPGSYDNIRKRSRLALSKPSPSLVAGNLQGTRSHIHPTENRELTNRECARIQGFADSFCFAGSHAAVGKQIANAVPIPLGKAIAQSLIDSFGS